MSYLDNETDVASRVSHVERYTFIEPVTKIDEIAIKKDINSPNIFGTTRF
jgi:hypothetical protein